MSLDIAHEKLGWPSASEILEPSGEGARVFAELARAKIGTAFGSAQGRIGVLSSDSTSSATQPPLAIVCESERTIPETTLHQVQKLAWNFSRSPMLVTLEPHLLRAWTCCEPPGENLFTDQSVHEVRISDLASDLSQRTARTLHWVNLVSGQFFKDNAPRFRRDHRADQMLLDNLDSTRQALHEKGLDSDDVCHDLLARIIFIQFLFDRKDSTGNAALNEGMLERLHHDGVLRSKHENFASVLSNYHETYRFFGWLDDRFNGDLFPGKGGGELERERAWRLEKQQVKPTHLEVLSELVGGRLRMSTGQTCLWREYAFDAIPLEFISSILEAFVGRNARKAGIYFTPPNLVDFALDQVLPWSGDRWNLKVLDPACGSGVFLVKAFQRLVYRWKNANIGQSIRVDTLRSLLENNLFGVDTNRHAVRVASFSLYLAMCDEIDPKYYWTKVRFPIMRERQLINADFFREDRVGFRTREDMDKYDLVVGNVPWGESMLTAQSKDWSSAHDWPVADKGIGPLFLPKAAALAKPSGRVCLIESASSLLFNRSGPAREFRKKLFSTFRVEQVVNLSALRFKLFKKKGPVRKTVSPPCVVVLSPEPPDTNCMSYISPKAIEGTGEAFEITIEPADVKEVYPIAAANDADLWATLMWGNHRDLDLVRRLAAFPSLSKLEAQGRLRCREGIIRGTPLEEHEWLINRRILERNTFPSGSLLFLRADDLPENKDPWAERPRKERDFSTPQLLIKQSWSKRSGRYQARLVVPDKEDRGVVCTQSFLSVVSHTGDDQSFLEAACLAYNSSIGVYFLLLASGRFASYRPEALGEEIRDVPIPIPIAGLLDGLNSAKDIDRRARQAFGLKPAEWVLVEDLCGITLRDFKGGEDSPGRLRTHRMRGSRVEPELESYCNHFVRVLKAGFGKDKQISATVFQEEEGADLLPFRLIAFQLDSRELNPLRVETLDTSELLAEMEVLNKTWLKNQRTNTGSIYHQRVARIYDHRGDIPTVFIVKPDAYRYWSRSMGLHDADDVTADLLRWRDAASAGVGRGW